MSRDFYENIIPQAEDLGQLRIIHKFLINDLHLVGADHNYINSLISKAEANMLLDMQIGHMPDREALTND